MPEILFPAGRMIGGSLDKLYPVYENDGKTPKLDKAGNPLMKCNLGFAIPKAGEQHWAHTAWGKVIYDTGAAAYPNMVQNPAFSWKITDGDSTVPNQNNKIPCQQVGYPGHWVLWFSQSWLPNRVSANGQVKLPEGSIVPGFYIQVYGSVAGNTPKAGGKAGVYLNPIHVALVGEGDRIATEADATTVGFGAAPLPAGARPVTAVAPEFAPPIAPAPAPAPVAAPPMPAPAPVPPQVVTPPTAPNPAFMAPPPAPAPVPPVPAAPVAPAGPVMTAKAGGVTYEQFRAQGWTDEQLREQGYMQ